MLNKPTVFVLVRSENPPVIIPNKKALLETKGLFSLSEQKKSVFWIYLKGRDR